MDKVKKQIMRAMVSAQYGTPDVFKLEEVAKPVPKDNEILVRVFASTVNFGDLMARNFKAVTPAKFTMPLLLWFPTKLFFGLEKPNNKILGNEFAGEIEAVGGKVSKFKIGDKVFGYRGPTFGAYCEYLCAAENSLVAIKPSNMSYEEAAALPYGAITALSLLRQAGIKNGQKILINGASGEIGSAAVQLAKYFGAQVTGVCGTAKQEYVKALGADKVLDYTKADFTKNNETYDLIFDVINKSTFKRCKASLTVQGTYFLASFKTGRLFEALFNKLSGSKKKMMCALSEEKQNDLIFIKELAEQGKVKSIIDKKFSLEQTAQAHRYVEEGKDKGKVVITVGA